MTYDLFIGDRSFSSWSLRGWLMFENFGLPVTTYMTDLYGGDFLGSLAGLEPARLVPVLRLPDGTVIGETLAMAETLAERHPDAGLWPEAPAARAAARWLCSEMHAGFGALRNDCPMQLLARYEGYEPSTEVLRDLERIATLFAYAEDQKEAEGPWLFGAYSLADVFYAPVAARIAGYGLPVAPQVERFVAHTLADPAFRRWRSLGLTVRYDPVPYAIDLPQTTWPGPRSLPAKVVNEGTPINDACPYSGKPATHLAEIAGRIIGFCNPTCRDKTVNDPEAWPAAMRLLNDGPARLTNG